MQHTKSTCEISKVHSKIHLFRFSFSCLGRGLQKSQNVGSHENFPLYGIFGDGHNPTELHWGRVWEQ